MAKARPNLPPRPLAWTLVPTSLQKPRQQRLPLRLQQHQLVPSPLLRLPKKADRLSSVTAKSPVGNGGGFLR
jgi:hypothetical protein